MRPLAALVKLQFLTLLRNTTLDTLKLTVKSYDYASEDLAVFDVVLVFSSHN